MIISEVHLVYILEALQAGLEGINNGTSTHGDPADLHLNRVGHDARTKIKTAIALAEKLKAADEQMRQKVSRF